MLFRVAAIGKVVAKANRGDHDQDEAKDTCNTDYKKLKIVQLKSK